MSYNGSGTFQINTTGQPVVAGTVISSTAFNALTADLATGLSTAITKDGQTATTARIPFAAGINSTLVTDSTSTSTGSIITAGGAGIAKALYVGTTANIAGASTFTGAIAVDSVTDSSSTTTGSIQTDGGLGVAKAVFIGTTLNVASTTTLTGVATLTANPVLSAGTANGVTYLNGSKSLTSGTGLVFDGTNLGIGVTPSAWSSGKAIELGNAGNSFWNNGASENHVTTNAYYNVGWKFGGTGYAQKLTAVSGQYQFNVSTASGTAGNAITFTQAMTLNASGRLLLGSTTDNGGTFQMTGDYSRFSDGTYAALIGRAASIITGAAAADLGIYSSNNTVFSAGGSTERMRITSSGNVLINRTTVAGAGNVGLIISGDTDTTSTNYTFYTIYSNSTQVFGLKNDGSVRADGVYNTTTASAANVNVASTGVLARSTSALKYKKDIRDLEFIDINKFRPVRYKSKCENDDQTLDHFGIVADEVDKAGIKELVNYDAKNEVEGFQYERLTVVLLKAIQEQQTLIITLTARITALESK